MLAKLFKLSLIFALALALALVLTMPLSLFIKDGKYNNVHISGLSGSIWQAKIARLSIDTRSNYGQQVIDNLRFKLQPGYLFLGRAQAVLDFEYLQGHGNAVLALKPGNKLELYSGSFSGDAANIGEQFAMGFADVGGKFELQLARGAIDLGSKLPLYAQGNLLWQQAKMLAPIELSLGNVQVDIDKTAAAGPLSANLHNQGGALKLNMRAELGGQGQWQLNGEISKTAQTPQLLSSNLDTLLGKAVNGSYKIVRSGRL